MCMLYTHSKQTGLYNHSTHTEKPLKSIQFVRQELLVIPNEMMIIKLCNVFCMFGWRFDVSHIDSNEYLGLFSDEKSL